MSIRADIQDIVTEINGLVTIFNHGFSGALTDQPAKPENAISGANYLADQILSKLELIHQLSNQIN